METTGFPAVEIICGPPVCEHAKVAMARKLAVRLYWMMCKEWNYEPLKKFGSYAGESDYVHGVQ